MLQLGSSTHLKYQENGKANMFLLVPDPGQYFIPLGEQWHWSASLFFWNDMQECLKCLDIQCPTSLTFMVEACQSWQGYASCFNQLNQFSIKVVGLLFFGHCFNQFVLYSFTTTMKSPFSWNLFQFNFLAKLHFYIKLHSYGSQFSVIIMINKAM